MVKTIIINFRGGIISPGDLYNILVAASRIKVGFVRFGLRQQLLIDVDPYDLLTITGELDKLMIAYEVDTVHFPNIISSYPAEEVFIRNTWLSEGVYKDILDDIDFKPSVKVNICDSNQSFTPMLTGNINWIASASSEHYWHLVVRFPKTNVIYEWDQICYSNSIAGITKEIERLLKEHAAAFVDNREANGKELFQLLNRENFILKPAGNSLNLPQFNLPYYEGLNRYNNKYWLGIYRRDELYSVRFLKKLCTLCLDTKLGQLCCTSWKSIIIKGIEEKDKLRWNLLLEEFQINMRHAANELNFQVEDNCAEGLALKNYLVKYLGADDTRTFGICIGIKTRKKSEVFSSILIRRRYLINIFGIKMLRVYDILCAKDFNPNERTGEVFSKGNPRVLLPEQLRRSVLAFSRHRAKMYVNQSFVAVKKEEPENVTDQFFYQCPDCFTVYDEKLGDAGSFVKAGTLFEDLPADYICSVCDTSKSGFIKIKDSSLVSHAI